MDHRQHTDDNRDSQSQSLRGLVQILAGSTAVVVGVLGFLALEGQTARRAVNPLPGAPPEIALPRAVLPSPVPPPPGSPGQLQETPGLPPSSPHGTLALGTASTP